MNFAEERISREHMNEGRARFKMLRVLCSVCASVVLLFNRVMPYHLVGRCAVVQAKQRDKECVKKVNERIWRLDRTSCVFQKRWSFF